MERTVVREPELLAISWLAWVSPLTSWSLSYSTCKMGQRCHPWSSYRTVVRSKYQNVQRMYLNTWYDYCSHAIGLYFMKHSCVKKKGSYHKKYSGCRNNKSAAFICKCLIWFWLAGNGIHPLFLGILGFKLGPYFFLKNKQTHFYILKRYLVKKKKKKIILPNRKTVNKCHSHHSLNDIHLETQV